MDGLVALSTRLVVMAERGREMLQDIYQVRPSKIDLIPHGIPDVGFVDPTYFKDQFDVEGKVVILNSVAEQLTGYSQAEAAGRFLSEISPFVEITI